MRRPDGTWDPLDDYVLDFAIERLLSGEKTALVTLVEIEGTSPRPLGAQMAVAETGAFVGYLSGGCIERAVAAEAMAAIRVGRSRRVRYGRGSRYIDISLPCGSAIELVFDVDLSLAGLREIDDRLARRLPGELEIPLLSERADEPRSVWRTYLPRRRLIALGAGPVAVQLARLAAASGFSVVLQSPDDTTLEAVADAGVETVRMTNPERAEIEADERSAICFVFHDHLRERALLGAALRTDAFFIGAMGSSGTQRQRIEMLREQGFAERDLARIRGPVGLLANARSAPDLALSIVAQIVDEERKALAGGSSLLRENPACAVPERLSA